ncbi:hypothetical protein TNIN_153111 [Trichonephila inaurata madagascariensis]|uniref:Uncharacterized protein n=1 Tax=Trichonephila inaurata madagascariensis TaxID=2747483 RepID=A0A8X7BSX8_9ARAC|nr:hypothetical protein TNIN_153111 [Trichonephila inaurata madagascariensis]
MRALRYVPDGKIVYKLRHTNTVWEEFPIKTKKICAVPWSNIPQLYSARLKIKKEEYLHLQALKDTMEKEHHNTPLLKLTTFHLLFESVSLF